MAAGFSAHRENRRNWRTTYWFKCTTRPARQGARAPPASVIGWILWGRSHPERVMAGTSSKRRSFITPKVTYGPESGGVSRRHRQGWHDPVRTALNASGQHACVGSQSAFMVHQRRLLSRCAVMAVLRTRPPVGEEGEEVGCADGAVAVEVGWTAGVKALWSSNIHD